MPNHPDFVPFTEADFAEIFGSSECSGLEPVMERTLSNLAVTTETGSCPVLVRAVGCECGEECENCTGEEVTGAELMDRLRAEEGDNGQV